MYILICLIAYGIHVWKGVTDCVAGKGFGEDPVDLGFGFGVGVLDSGPGFGVEDVGFRVASSPKEFLRNDKLPTMLVIATVCLASYC